MSHKFMDAYAESEGALFYKPEDCGFETLWGELIFSICLILSAALGPGVYSAYNRNEYQKQKNDVSGE
jgi:hypothetical protein